MLCSCGREFEPKHGKQKHCSPKCQHSQRDKRSIEKQKMRANMVRNTTPPENIPTMKLTEFAKLKQRPYYMIKTACQYGFLDACVDHMGRWHIILNEKSEQFVTKEDKPCREIIFKWEYDENGKKVPQDCWTYKGGAVAEFLKARITDDEKDFNRPVSAKNLYPSIAY